MKINPSFHILVFFISILTCVVPLATYAQHSSTSTRVRPTSEGKIPSEVYYDVGIFAGLVPDKDFIGTIGYRIGLSYETPSYAIEVKGLLFDTDLVHFTASSLGAHYFLNRRNISSYVGGGYTISSTSHGTSYGRGMGVFLITGLQMFRFKKHRLKFEYRVDRPFYTLDSLSPTPITIGIFYSRDLRSILRWR